MARLSLLLMNLMSVNFDSLGCSVDQGGDCCG